MPGFRAVPQHAKSIALSRWFKNLLALTPPKPQQTHASQWVRRGLATR